MQQYTIPGSRIERVLEYPHIWGLFAEETSRFFSDSKSSKLVEVIVGILCFSPEVEMPPLCIHCVYSRANTVAS